MRSLVMTDSGSIASGPHRLELNSSPVCNSSYYGHVQNVRSLYMLCTCPSAGTTQEIRCGRKRGNSDLAGATQPGIAGTQKMSEYGSRGELFRTCTLVMRFIRAFAAKQRTILAGAGHGCALGNHLRRHRVGTQMALKRSHKSI